MIVVTIYRDGDRHYAGFECLGHSGYADHGEDIVCAGASALVLNTINSIEQLTETRLHTEADEESGHIEVEFINEPDAGTLLLVSSMILGLQQITENYGDEFISLQFKEV